MPEQPQYFSIAENVSDCVSATDNVMKHTIEEIFAISMDSVSSKNEKNLEEVKEKPGLSLFNEINKINDNLEARKSNKSMGNIKSNILE
jgi:hypothetical protein